MLGRRQFPNQPDPRIRTRRAQAIQNLAACQEATVGLAKQRLLCPARRTSHQMGLQENPFIRPQVIIRGQKQRYGNLFAVHPVVILIH
ncbi:MAG TPA: hypothetical protein VNY05_33730 [Candidatus Acidoferrales bacterium]|nr:hypothetical protein [Candidatus Acidoferrales bacterium]